MNSVNLARLASNTGFGSPWASPATLVILSFTLTIFPPFPKLWYVSWSWVWRGVSQMEEGRDTEGVPQGVDNPCKCSQATERRHTWETESRLETMEHCLYVKMRLEQQARVRSWRVGHHISQSASQSNATFRITRPTLNTIPNLISTQKEMLIIDM